MTNPPEHELLSAYLDGELSADDRVRVDQWLATDADARRAVEEFRALSATLKNLPAVPLDEDLSQRVLQTAEQRLLAPSPSADDGRQGPSGDGRGQSVAAPLETAGGTGPNGPSTATTGGPAPASWRLGRLLSPRVLAYSGVAVTVAVLVLLASPPPEEVARAPEEPAAPAMEADQPAVEVPLEIRGRVDDETEQSARLHEAQRGEAEQAAPLEVAEPMASPPPPEAAVTAPPADGPPPAVDSYHSDYYSDRDHPTARPLPGSAGQSGYGTRGMHDFGGGMGGVGGMVYGLDGYGGYPGESYGARTGPPPWQASAVPTAERPTAEPVLAEELGTVTRGVLVVYCDMDAGALQGRVFDDILVRSNIAWEADERLTRRPRREEAPFFDEGDDESVDDASEATEAGPAADAVPEKEIDSESEGLRARDRHHIASPARRQAAGGRVSAPQEDLDLVYVEATPAQIEGALAALNQRAEVYRVGVTPAPDIPEQRRLLAFGRSEPLAAEGDERPGLTPAPPHPTRALREAEETEVPAEDAARALADRRLGIPLQERSEARIPPEPPSRGIPGRAPAKSTVVGRAQRVLTPATVREDRAAFAGSVPVEVRSLRGEAAPFAAAAAPSEGPSQPAEKRLPVPATRAAPAEALSEAVDPAGPSPDSSPARRAAPRAEKAPAADPQPESEVTDPADDRPEAGTPGDVQAAPEVAPAYRVLFVLRAVHTATSPAEDADE